MSKKGGRFATLFGRLRHCVSNLSYDKSSKQLKASLTDFLVITPIKTWKITMKIIVLICLLLLSNICDACTAFGVVTTSGTIIGQNLDYYYAPQQKFELMIPIQQFNNWYENNYGHNNKFYALVSANNIQMGINEHGLTVLEENAPFPTDYKKYRKFQQPVNGNAEGMVKYGILQNFNSVDEIIPFIYKIFSVAQPDFYQIADAKKVLTVEVAYGTDNADLKRKFTYRILSKHADAFTHTNFYLSSNLASLNHLKTDLDYMSGAENRFKKITELLAQSKSQNIDVAANWLMNTNSNISNKTDPNWCQNTSLFRSNLQGEKSIVVGAVNNKIYGTVSNMIVSNNGDLKNSVIYLRMIDSISTDSSHKQVIKYRELRTSLAELFSQTQPQFVRKELVRDPPINNICN